MPFLISDRQYWDVPTHPGQHEATLVRHYAALKNAVNNLFQTQVGDRGGLFRPLWGSRLKRYLHEPVSERTILMLKMELHYLLRKFFPLLSINMARTQITELQGSDGPGLHVRMVVSTEIYDRIQVDRTFEFDIRSL